METNIDKIALRVKQLLHSSEAGHDWLHISRVYHHALLIAATIPDCNLHIVKLASLLHDIADSKFNEGNEEIGPKMAQELMTEYDIPEQIIAEVIQIIRNISYKGGFKTSDYQSVELDIVRDADRLDAIGAIGIARVFTFGGFKNRRLYDPDIKPVNYENRESYKNSNPPTINHFYEKLLKLKDGMTTEKGRQMAEQRHRFMESYLEQFFAEIGIDLMNSK
jgi:uncharacterized protein